MPKQSIHCKKGLTLMELLIVIALVAVVAIVGYNAVYFGVKSYSEAQKKWEAEVAVRYTSELLSKQLSTASFLDIRNTPTASWYTSPSYQYIFINNDRIMYQNSTGSAVPLVAMTNGKLSVEFTKPLNTSDGSSPHNPVSNVLSYKIIAKDQSGNEIYSMTSSVMLRNFLVGTDVPVNSLYSAANATLYTPGNSIKYWNEAVPIVPAFPGISYSCGCALENYCGCVPSPPGDLNTPPN